MSNNVILGLSAFLLIGACQQEAKKVVLPVGETAPVKEAENINEPKSKPMPIARSTAPIPDWAKSIILPVRGMTCSGCEMAINEALEKNEGIFRSEANHFNANVKVHYDPKKVRPVDMVNTINELGYHAELFMQKDKDLKPVDRKPTKELKGHEKVGQQYLEKSKATFKPTEKTP